MAVCAFHQYCTLFGSLSVHCVCPVRALQLRSVRDPRSLLTAPHGTGALSLLRKVLNTGQHIKAVNSEECAMRDLFLPYTLYILL